MTRLKAAGVDLAAIGQTQLGEDDAEVLQFSDPARGTYKKLVIRNERLVGAILLGEIATVGTVTQLYDRGAPVPADRLGLLFAPRRGGTADPPDSAGTVCRCNGVTGEAIEACWRDGARTVEQVAGRTRATTGCGGCRPDVARTLEQLGRGAG